MSQSLNLNTFNLNYLFVYESLKKTYNWVIFQLFDKFILKIYKLQGKFVFKCVWTLKISIFVLEWWLICFYQVFEYIMY